MITKAYLIDLVERAVWTFGQGFVSALVLAWGGAGLDVQHVTDWSSWQKVGVAAVGGGVAAVLSLVKSVIAGFVTGSASTSKTVAATAVEQPGDRPPVTVETSAGQHEAAA